MQAHLKDIVLIGLLYVREPTFEDHLGIVYQCDVLAEFLHGFHAVGGEDNSRPPIPQPQDLILDDVRVYGIETTERFIKNDQLGLVQDRHYELYLLSHPLGQLLYFLVPPIPDLQSIEPKLQPLLALRPGKSLEPGQIEGLLPDPHALVQPAFFGQVSDMRNMLGDQGLPHEEKTAAVLTGNLVYDSYKCGLPGPIGAQKSINAVLWDFKGDVAQGRFVSVGFGNIFGRKDMIHSNNFFKDMELHPIPTPYKNKTHP